MSKIAVVYWSGTGNTEEMANAVADGAKAAGGEAILLTSGEFEASMTENYDAIAFGCPSMGAEELEEEEFAPMFEACESRLEGKKIALFGSYGWGDGEWMRNWEDTCRSDGAVLVCDSVICNDAPDEEAVAACKALGAALAAA
ncbi:MAG TPA: flavodoxin [Candidatus Blautia stercoravium]|nr:flavodoxin [Candidatus Blautia stercoravium]